jgi:hypothetical protein
MKLLIKILLFFISLKFLTLQAIVDSTENKRILLMEKYYDIKCDFLDKNSDLFMQKKCCAIAKQLFKIPGNKKHLWFLASHYLKGIGIKKDIVKGLKLFEEIADSDCDVAVDAQYMLGIYYGAEDSSVRNLNKAEYWLKKASINGELDAQCDYAILLENQGKKEESLYWYKNAAKKDNLRAKYWLAHFVRKGENVGISRKKAYKMLHSIAEKNFEPAFQELSMMYWQDGNNEKAKYWYCKFIHTEFFKNIQEGVDPNKAFTKAVVDDIKKQYGIEENNLDQKTN